LSWKSSVCVTPNEGIGARSSRFRALFKHQVLTAVPSIVGSRSLGNKPENVDEDDRFMFEKRHEQENIGEIILAPDAELLDAEINCRDKTSWMKSTRPTAR
jgi:hypothetical protein